MQGKRGGRLDASPLDFDVGFDVDARQHILIVVSSVGVLSQTIWDTIERYFGLETGICLRPSSDIGRIVSASWVV